MSDTDRNEWHERFAKEFFDRTWTLLEGEKGSDDETAEMIGAAHASLHHWRQVGEPVHFARGEWLVARVYAEAGRPASALHHARRCLAITEAAGLGDFDLAFAFEGMARAHAVAERWRKSGEFLAKAREAGAAIAKKEDRVWFFQELESIPEQATGA